MTVSLTRVYNPNPGWYRGDFHAHTTCSDGSLTPRNLSHLAAETGLDFLAITDHNDISAFDDLDLDHQRLVIPGVELTLHEGHFNVFGFAGNSAEARQIFRGIVDAPLYQKHNLSLKHSELKALIERASLAGYFVSLNHPLLEPWEWREPLADIGWFDGIELVNDPTYGENYRLNPAALRLWSAWLNAGYRCTGLGGSDFHSLEPSDNPNRLSRLDLPLTYVYAEQLSAMAILDGLRHRRAYISLGPQVELTLEVAGRAFAMGEDVGLVLNPGRLSARIWDCGDRAQVILVRNGKALARAVVQNGAAEIVVEIPANEALVQAWYRVDVLDAANRILAVSNPIFVGPQRSPAPRSYGSFAGSYSQY